MASIKELSGMEKGQGVAGGHDSDLGKVRLLEGVAAGSERDLKRLYDSHGGLVFGVAYKILGESREAEEVTQDVFVKVWRRAHSYDPRLCSLKGWICMIARSAAIDRLRHHSRRPRLVGVENFDILPSAEEPTNQAADHHESIAAALKDLRPEHRRSLELAYFKGHTQREISQLMGVPIGTVKTFMKRGMAKLRKAFSREESE